MENDKEERIRRRAHELWEREGRPDGREAEHWDVAERELERDAAASVAEGGLKVAPYNDPTRPGGPVEGRSYPEEQKPGRA